MERERQIMVLVAVFAIAMLVGIGLPILSSPSAGEAAHNNSQPLSSGPRP